MKQTILTMAFAFAIAIFANAQIKVFSGTPKKVAIGSTTTPNQSLDVTGDISLVNTTDGYRINNNYMLWNNGKTGCIYVGTAGSSSNTGSNNIFMGYQAGNANTSGTPNLFIGYQAGLNSTVSNDNVAVGYQALKTQAYGTATSTYNTAVGHYALFTTSSTSSSNGFKNVGFGRSAGYYNSTGAYGTFLGYCAGANNASGNENTCVGYAAGYNINSTGEKNTFLGSTAGYSTTTGNGGVFIGYQAGYYNTTGACNIAIGWTTGSSNLTTGNYNTFLGYNAVENGNYSNAMALGNFAVANNTNDIVLGNNSVQTLRCNVQTITALSDRRIKNNIKENVHGLDFINLLKPVTYNYDIHKENSIIGYPMKTVIDVSAVIDSSGNIISPAQTHQVVDTSYWDGKYNAEKKLLTGLIAQQVDSAAQTIGYDFDGVYKPKDANHIYGLSYTQFIVPLIKAVQELSHKVDSLSNAKSTQRTEQNGSNEKNSLDIKLNLPEGISIGEARPNPNNGKCEIDYYLPSTVSNSELIFSDIFGRVINKTKLASGYGTVTVDTQDLPNGTYTYSLIANEKLIDTKKMIRNK